MKKLILQTHLLGVLLVLSTLLITSGAWGKSKDKMLLSDVKALTLRQGLKTNGRRSAPVPQLKCVGGSAQHKFQPKTVQCINVGSDGYDAQWECKAEMDNAYKFGHVEVTCEGYDYPTDRYILRGSCGLEYTIELTEEGQAREGKGGSYSSGNFYQTSTKKGEGNGLFWFIAFCVGIFVIYKTCIAPNQAQQQNSRAEPSAPADDQPPPYGFRPEFQGPHGPPPTGPPPSYESTQQGSSYANQGFSSSCSDDGTRTNQENTSGGFWSGAATGGILGYLFGASGNNRRRRGWGGWGNTWNNGWGGWGNNGWGNSWGGWGNTQHHHHHHHTPSRPSSNPFYSNTSSSTSSSSGSSGSRTTSGFGGTSRR